MYNAPTELDQISESQTGKADTANDIFAALSSAAVFGIKASLSSGLSLTLYGGNIDVAGTPTAIADQAITLTASATNYLYATSAGVVTKVTSAPSGWPGPMASGATALYELDTDETSITGGTNYLLSVGATGETGPPGADGPAASDFGGTRKKIYMPIGGGSVTNTMVGLSSPTTVGTATARTLASASLRQSIPYHAYLSSASAGNSAQVSAAENWCYLGNAAGRGGFKLYLRFCLESALSPATARCFFGLFPAATIANAEPDTFLNTIGIGAKAGEANLSLLHNDGSGTATKTLLVSDDVSAVNFPARATDNVYELSLISVANSQSISYQLDNINDEKRATGTINSNIPANATFLTWGLWVNNGTTASQVAVGVMQAISETRY